MKKHLWLILLLLVVVIGAALLFRLGHYYIEYAFAAPRLEVDSSTVISARKNRDVELDLYGSGFTEATRVSLVPSVNSGSAVIGSLPLDGIFNVSLIVGDTLFLGSNSDGVKVIDISLPREPKLVGTYLAGRPVLDIQRQGKLFYFACGPLGIAIMAWADDRQLIPQAEFSVAGVALACMPQHGYLFVAAGAQGLQVYDVDRSGNGELVNRYHSGAFVLDVAFYRDHFYLSTRNATLDILRFDSTLQPQPLHQVPLQEIPRDMTVVEDKLYLATPSRLLLFDLADPASPSRQRQWNEIGSAGKIFIGKQRVYVCDSHSHLHSVDTESLELRESFTGVGDIRVLSEKGRFFFLAGSDQGLLIVDRTRLRGGALAGTMIDTPGSVHDLLLVGDWLYVADAQGGVRLIDLSADGRFGQRQVTPRRAQSLALFRDRIYVAQGEAGLALLDVRSPAQPTELAHWPDIAAWRLANLGPYLVVGQGSSGLAVIDTRNLNQPQVTDRLSAVHPLEIAADNGRVFVASKDQGLLIYRVAEKGKLLLAGKVVLPFPMSGFAHPLSVAVEDDVAYVANGSSGLLIVDAAEGRRPEIIALLALPGSSKQVRLIGNRAIVSARQGISAVDIADPAQPHTLGSFTMMGLSRGLQVKNDRLYVGRYQMGVSVLPLPLEASEVERISSSHMRARFPSVPHEGVYDVQINNRLGSAIDPGVLSFE